MIFNCKKELWMKMEEADKLKIEGKDLNEIKRLQKELNKKSVDYSDTMEEGTDDGEECILPKKVLKKNFPKPRVYPA